MKIGDYYRDVLVPANSAVAAIRRAGLLVDLARIRSTRAAWLAEVGELEALVTGAAAERGFFIPYSAKHGLQTDRLADFLYSPAGLGLEVYGYTQGGKPSTDDDALMPYASLAVPRPDDHPVVRAVLQIRSLAGSVGKYLDSFERTRRADGCCHPTFNWALKTARISAENPPVHQIPERADKRVADAIKACIVPRVSPAPRPGDWDPRRHGSTFRWDIVGAEACIRGAMLTHRFCSRPDPVAYDYLRLGKDIHSKTASLVYGVPDGTYKKGSYERDAVGKQTFFAKIFGATWKTVQRQVYAKARVWLTDDQARAVSANFDAGYSGLTELYGIDKRTLGERGYCEDAYGRRRRIAVPPEAAFAGGEWAPLASAYGGFRRHAAGDTVFAPGKRTPQAQLDHCFHVMANTPTQSTNATDNVWMAALCFHGEYVGLRVPPMWERGGIPFPEAKDWRMHGGPGPGGRPLLAWHMNVVHDAGWGDSAPGEHLESAAKVVWRRCRALPLDWRIEADVPYRIDLSVGPDMGNLRPYNDAAKEFGLEPVPER